MTDVSVEAPHGSVRLRRYSPPAGRVLAEFVWVHGGGFFAGNLDMPESDAVGRVLAACGVRVWTVDYRRARPSWRPEQGNRYPVPLDDVVTAIQHRQRSEALPLLVGGASAGACLVASALKRAALKDVPPPAGVVFAYGLFHAALPRSLHGTTFRSRGHRRITHSGAALRLMAWNYAGLHHTRTAPDAFPGDHPSAALPPALFLDADRDALRASSTAFAQQLEAAGTAVTRSVVRGSEHGFLNRPHQAHFQAGIDSILTWTGTVIADSSNTNPRQKKPQPD